MNRKEMNNEYVVRVDKDIFQGSRVVLIVKKGTQQGEKGIIVGVRNTKYEVVLDSGRVEFVFPTDLQVLSF